jgi:DNA-binding protein YbaB
MPETDSLTLYISQALKLTRQLEKRKAALAQETVEGTAGNGAVVVTATGVQTIRSVWIDSKVDTSNSVRLAEWVLLAINAALAASKEYERVELLKISGGLKLPGVVA